MSATAARPDAPPAWVDDLLQQADAAHARGSDALAAAILQRAAAAAPQWPPAARRLGLLLWSLGRAAEAEPALRRAVVLAPYDAELRHALGLSLLALGRYAEGAALAEARFELPQLGARKPAGFPFPEWRGEPLQGRRLVVFPEQAAGDLILAARFVPRLQAQGATVTLLCPPELVRLFAESLPGVAVIAATGAVEFADPDAWTMSGSLVGRLARSPAALPQPPYLRTARPELPYLRAPGGEAGTQGGFRVGLATGDLPDDEAGRLGAGLPGQVVELPSGAGDLAEVAAQMAGLDLVVCADGTLAHLAGALGKPTLVLVRAHDAHWSFARGPQVSAWYPTLNLFRADPKTGWTAAVEAVLVEAQARGAG